jgi:hypothetical protein
MGPSPLAIAFILLVRKSLQLEALLPIGDFSLPPQVAPEKTKKTVLCVLADVDEFMPHKSWRDLPKGTAEEDVPTESYAGNPAGK